ncbi:MAG: hypothetical protein HQL03_03490 [Nitrospirae bacterium]|nr:hypothetical protein [Nitrospirota bacterium]
MQLRQPDLVLEVSDGRLFHIEFQLTNDKDMPIRMLRCYMQILEHYGKGAEQVVLYVGNLALRMPKGIRKRRLVFEYGLRDIREIDSRKLLESDRPEDMVLSILGKM